MAGGESLDGYLILRTIYALAMVGLLLLGLWWIVRSLRRGRIVLGADRRLVSVVDSTFLAQNTSLHVVKVADRYYLVGGGAGHVALISEVPADAVVPWIESHRVALNAQTEPVAALLRRLRSPRT